MELLPELWGEDGKRGERIINIYIDDGKTVKIYSLSDKVAESIITLLDCAPSCCSETNEGYGVVVVDKESEG